MRDTFIAGTTNSSWDSVLLQQNYRKVRISVAEPRFPVAGLGKLGHGIARGIPRNLGSRGKKR